MVLAVAKALAGLALLQGADAYWRMPCGVIQTGRIDPIISPGTVAGHVHKISGPPNVSPNSTYDSLQNTRCTSCQVQGDKSAYWTPLLYYQHKNGSFEEVQAGGMTVYYLGRGENASYIQPFPKGFRMLSGVPNLRAYDNSTYTYGGTQGVIYTGGHCQTGDLKCTGGHFVNRTGTSSDPSGPTFYGRPVSDRVSYNCLDSSGPMKETPAFSNTNCNNGLRAQIQFPSCWDGVNLYKADNSHVDYLSQIDNGVCPPSHPILFPHLFFEVLYDVAGINTDGGEYAFAMGDPTGYGFHGDFLNGWDEALLQNAITQCVNVDKGGGLDTCAPFNATLDYNSAYNCPEQPPYFDEPVHGMLSKLPGCNNVTYGPAPAPYSDNTCPAGTSNPTANTTYPYSGGTDPVLPAKGFVQNNFKYIGCFTDDSPHSFSQASLKADNMTNAVCQSFCAGKNMPLAATEFGRECYCGYQFSTPTNNATSCNSIICSGNSSEYCGSQLTLNAWNSTKYTGTYNPVTPTPGAKTGGYTYLGCATDVTYSRVLSGAVTKSMTNMTNDLCASYCSSQGMPLFGTEYSSECYCGSSIASSALGATGCTYTCSGNTPSSGPFANYANICGGSNRLSVWNNTNAASAASSSATLATSSASTVKGSATVTSSASTSSALSAASSFSLSTTRASLSTSVRSSSSSSSSASAPSATSPSKAGANSDTSSTSPFTYLGCSSEATSGRALNISSTTSSTNMTNAACASYCASRSLPLFGTEYGSECYCGTALAPGASLDASGCSMPCSGSTSSFSSSSPFASAANVCGGSSKLSVWNNTAIAAVSNVKSLTVGSGSAASQWGYKGCYAEASSGRALSGATYTSGTTMSPTSCLGYCAGKGFKVAGMEYGGECYCGSAMPSNGTKADEWSCGMQCNGALGSWCGGSSRLSVYTVSV